MPFLHPFRICSLVYSIKVFIRETVHIKNSYHPPPPPQKKKKKKNHTTTPLSIEPGSRLLYSLWNQF